jgi:acetyl-CoA acetyltransferase
MKKRYPGVKFSQFTGAEMMAQKWELTREKLDAFGISSHQKAARATKEGIFEREIMPVEATQDDGAKKQFKQDEGIRYDASLEAMASLKGLSELNLLTAGTSSQISDGAAAGSSSTKTARGSACAPPASAMAPPATIRS